MLWVYRPPGMSQARRSKLPFSMGDPGPLSNTWFLGPPNPNTPKGISICSSVFARRRSQPTDRPRHSVCGFCAAGNESVPIQMAQCRFSGLARSNAKILIFFSNKTCGSNFVEQHPETVMVWNYRNAHCSSKKHEFVVSFIIIFRTLSFPMRPMRPER